MYNYSTGFPVLFFLLGETMPVFSPVWHKFLKQQRDMDALRRDFPSVFSGPRSEYITKNDKKAGDLATEVLWRCKLASLSNDELSELAKDLQEQVAVHGPEATSGILPNKALRKALQDVQQESSRQTLMGLGGGAAGGLLGGAAGALAMGITKGRQHAPVGGIMGALPGTLGGYVMGKRFQQRRELADRLREKL